MNYPTWRLLRGVGRRIDARFGPTIAARLSSLRRRTARALPAALYAVQYPGIRGRVHVDDHMMSRDDADTLRHYARVGREALDLVVEALRSAGRSPADVRACLDLPSGYGRVTRTLVSAFPASRITVADVDGEAVRFCRHEFAVDGFVIGTDARALRLPQQYDVIFVGSLLTHLDEEQCLELLRNLHAGLSPGGVLVVTTHGESCLDHLYAYGEDIASAEAAYRDGMARHGMHFAPYEGAIDWGITLHTHAWVENAVRSVSGDTLTPLGFRPRGWDHHQDVFSFRLA
jgi:SAM-dependent methyltransferase